MSTVGKIAVLGTIGVAGLGVGYTAWKYSKMKYVDIMLEDVHVTSPNFLEVNIRIKLMMHNPTTQDFQFTFPYVALHYDGIPIAASTVNGTVVNLKGNTTAHLDEIEIKLTMLSISLVIPKLIGDIRAKRTVMLDAVMQTSVPMFWGAWEVHQERRKSFPIKL